MLSINQLIENALLQNKKGHTILITANSKDTFLFSKQLCYFYVQSTLKSSHRTPFYILSKLSQPFKKRNREENGFLESTDMTKGSYLAKTSITSSTVLSLSYEQIYLTRSMCLLKVQTSFLLSWSTVFNINKGFVHSFFNSTNIY